MAIPVEFLTGEHADSVDALADVVTRRTTGLGPKCKLCNALRSNDPEVIAIHERVRKGAISQQEASGILKVSYAYFNKHFAHHIPNEIQVASMPYAKDLAIKEINSLEILQSKAETMIDRLGKWLATPIGDPHVEAAIKMLASEVRAWILVIEQLRGNLQTSPLIQLNQINIEMSKLETLVMEEMCPACKVRLAGRLETELLAK